MGTIFAGHALPDGGPCTILFPDIIGDEVQPFVTALADEVARNRLLADLPLISVTHIGLDTQRRPFVVLPFEAGPDLETHIQHNGPLSPLAALQVGVELTDTLVRLHYRTRVLGELRPWTIRLPARRTDRLAVLDLGLCRGLFRHTVNPPRPSPSFASPNVRSGQAPRPADDLYAVGAVVYFALTGQPPSDAYPSSHVDLGPFARFIDGAIMQALGKATAPQPITGMVQLARMLRGLRDLHRLSPAARHAVLRLQGTPHQPPPMRSTGPLPGGVRGFLETDGPVFETQTDLEAIGDLGPHNDVVSLHSALEILDDDEIERLRTGALPKLPGFA
jgi:serine/threonine protein kinase